MAHRRRQPGDAGVAAARARVRARRRHATARDGSGDCRGQRSARWTSAGGGARAARGTRRLHRPRARGHDARWARLRHQRPGAAGGGLFRRLAHAPQPRARAAEPRRAAAARRAHQPPRPRRRGLARALARRLPWHAARGLARPRLPRRLCHPRGTHRGAPAHAVHRQLLVVRGAARRAARGAAGDVRAPAARDRAHQPLRDALSRPGDQGPPGAEPAEGAGPAGASVAGARGHPVRLRDPGAAAGTFATADARGCRARLLRAYHPRQRAAHAAARRTPRAARRERCRQVHAGAGHRRRARPARGAPGRGLTAW